jgi:outer membrane protein assembly factor BamB
MAMIRHAVTIVTVVLLLTIVRPAWAVIDAPGETLAKQCALVQTISVLRVEKVNREKKGIVYRKARDLKGNSASPFRLLGDTCTHVFGESPTAKSHPQDSDNQILQNDAILAWAEEGKTAVIFQRGDARGSVQAICIGHAWYTANGVPPAKRPWVQTCAADSRMQHLFCGDVEELIDAITKIQADKEVTIPVMIGDTKMLSEHAGPIRRVRADKKLDFHSPFHWHATPWATHRANAWRTGADQGPGPKRPKVLWVHRSDNQFVAPLIAGAKELYAPSLGAFNKGGFHALALDPAETKRERWSRFTPILDHPVVAAPALVAVHTYLLIFGDGMHQSNRAGLHCLRAEDGFPMWRLPVPGKLVHFEASPTVAGTPNNRQWRLFVGGGGAGVLCVDPLQVTVEGKDQDLRAATSLREQRWREMLAKYAVDVKKDPMFTVRPDESMLPRATPKLLWQQGQDKWHVDAPVAVIEDRVLAASSYLEDEKIGERALISLKADDGTVLWKTPLKLNPWAGPTIGPYVLVGCSSARLDPQALDGARGEVVAVELDTGAVKWRKELPGGVLSSIAVREGLAIFTATDGKVRALDAHTGQERWTYDARAPFFAGPAVTAKTVYAADLKGVVHALNLSNGKRDWLLNLATDSATKTNAMVYGSPIIHGGRLYLATCRLADRDSQTLNLVVCVGER